MEIFGEEALQPTTQPTLETQQQPTLSAEVLERMEQNRQRALVTLQAKQKEREKSARAAAEAYALEVRMREEAAVAEKIAAQSSLFMTDV